MSQKIVVADYDFRGGTLPPQFASHITKTAGSPAVAPASASGNFNGGLALSLDATNEVQVASLYMNDVLPFNVANLVQLDIWASLTAAVAAAVSSFFGLASQRNDTLANIAERAIFRTNGNNELLAEAADGTNSQLGQDTGLTISTTPIRTTIGFKEGILTQSAPNLSVGGLPNLIYSAENARGQLRRVLNNKQFNISAATGGLQLMAQIQKTAAAAAATLTIYRMRVAFREGPNP